MTDGTSAITGIHIALIAVLAVLAIVAMIWGVRLKARRVQAKKEVEVHAEEAGVEIIPADAQVPPEPLPVAPLPPPFADQPTPGMPRAVRAHVEGAPAPEPLADEPIAAASAPEGVPATLATDAVVAEPAFDPADGPVTQIKGLGPRVATRLGELGIDRVGQLAALDAAGAAALDAQMGPFTGRITRDRWVEQARLLASGDREGFERVFGKL
ncbi:hypothetical protein [Sphingomonas sp.]|uniref:hypothetical protein n=1 Tax=Sphingomonas sp. TaxID=28214 RepID=UPI002ED9557A